MAKITALARMLPTPRTQELLEAERRLNRKQTKKYVVKIVWGSKPTVEEAEEQTVTYSLKTEAEFKAFNAGVEAAVGWMELSILHRRPLGVRAGMEQRVVEGL